jgi:hypothetical protein
MNGTVAIMRKLRDALVADVELTAYCMTKYGKTLKYFLGVDDAWMPEATNAPMFAMRPGNYGPAQDRSKRDVGVVCGIVIDQSAISTTATSKEMDGLSDMENLYERIERAIMRFAEDPNTYNGQIQFSDISSEIAYPLFRASWECTFQEDYQ